LNEGLGVTACDDEEVTSVAYPRHDPLERVDADGKIITGARRSGIQQDFWPILERAIGYLTRVETGSSLYVYGSVATGISRVGSSDVDLVTIGLDAAEAKRLASDLTATYRVLCRGVEIGPAQPADYEGGNDEAYGNRVFLRHYCVHLTGPDPAGALPTYPADKAAARGFNGDIGLRATQWRTELSDSASTSLARRIARKTLFAVAGLVSVHDADWTTDRVASAHRWGVIKPELAEALAMLASWGFTSSIQASKPEIQMALDGVVAEVVAEFQLQIGLWRSNRDA
jgi:uncharacterized protein